jgi:hypothetical protein
MFRFRWNPTVCQRVANDFLSELRRLDTSYFEFAIQHYPADEQRRLTREYNDNWEPLFVKEVELMRVLKHEPDSRKPYTVLIQ